MLNQFKSSISINFFGLFYIKSQFQKNSIHVQFKKRIKIRKIFKVLDKSCLHRKKQTNFRETIKTVA